MFVLLTLFIHLCYHASSYSIPTNISLVPAANTDGGNNQTGKEATCSKVVCPELDCGNEKVIQEEGKCCKSCDISDQWLIPSEPTTHCVVNGKVYTDYSFIPTINSSDPCEACHCYEGKILCKSIFETCPKLSCNQSHELLWDSNSCCPKCPLSGNQSHNQSLTCEQNGFIYEEGDVWNPYFPKLGVIDCLNCICMNGSINCKKLPCPVVRNCTEDDPVEDVTLCCPKCNRITSPTPNSQATPIPNITSTTTNESSSGMQPPTDITFNLIPDTPSKNPCVNSPYKVYESIDSQVDQIAIEIISSMDVFVWSTFQSMKYELYSSIKFINMFLNVRFRYIGSTNEDRLRKLKKRFKSRKMRKNPKYCQVNCAAKVISILKPCSNQ